MDSLLDFSDHVVLITGAGSGFGRLLAQGLALRGAKLVLSDINEHALTEVRHSLASSCDAITLAGDIALESVNQSLVDAAVNQFGRLDIAVNNAGIAHQLQLL